MKNSTVIVIRSSGERTLNFCREIVLEQISNGELHEVEISPFKAALEKSYDLALESKKTWLVTVDADMILTQNAIPILVSEAEKMPANYVQLQGRIFDKITGMERKAGPRIYRISLLKQLLDLSRTLPDNIRPENHIITEIGKIGLPSRYINRVTCIHDFEQSYRDLYRKAYVHARKHKELIPQIVENCVRQMDKDSDYKVILKAIYDGITESMEIAIDTRLFEDKSKIALTELGMEEKNDLNDDDKRSIQNLVGNYVKSGQSKDKTEYYDKPAKNKLNSYKEKIKRNGLISSLKNSVGTVLISVGNTLKRDN